MSAPVISSLALATVDIDPFVEYTYAIPVTGETSLAVTEIAEELEELQLIDPALSLLTVDVLQPTKFALSLSGRVLTVKYIGPFLMYDAVDPGGSNRANLTPFKTEFPIKITASNGDGITELSITFRIRSPEVQHVAAWSVSTTSVAVGDTTELTVNDPIVFTDYVSGLLTVLEGIPDPAYVKEIVDGTHIRISATPGGSAIDLSSVASPGTFLVLTYPRAYPVITSDHFLTVTPKAAVAYAITEDIAPDLYQVKGLPVELRLVDDDIVGVAPESGYYPITIMARLGLVDSLRTLVLIVDEI